jgi:hypothetical protein
VIDEATSLDNAITPEISFHWVGITLCIEKFIVLTQRSNLRAGIPVINSQDVSYVEYADGVGTKGWYNLIAETSKAKPKLEGHEENPGSK